MFNENLEKNEVIPFMRKIWSVSGNCMQFCVTSV